MSDKITIKKLELWCNIGLGSKERSKKQPLYADIELFLSLKEAGISDDITKTINYTEVCNNIKKLTEKEYVTIEGLAETIANNIKYNFKPDLIRVYIRKPGALKEEGAEYAAVEITR